MHCAICMCMQSACSRPFYKPFVKELMWSQLEELGCVHAGLVVDQVDTDSAGLANLALRRLFAALASIHLPHPGLA